MGESKATSAGYCRTLFRGLLVYVKKKLREIERKIHPEIEAALQAAKESGEFKGEKGDPGKDGYTPVKGVDYFDGADGAPGKDGEKGEKGDTGEAGQPGKDGYTPVKGVDYFDGINGLDGKDGYTPQKGVDYFDGQPGADGAPGKDGADGYTPVKGVDYFDGKDGQDGISVTHTWNGTVLEVTSASGTSSSDLKGEPGTPGADGKNGVDGYTPVKGTDYFTPAEVSEMVQRAVKEVLKITAPGSIRFGEWRLYAPAATASYTATNFDEDSVTFQYKGGGGVEELVFPITGLISGRTYTISFSETYNGGFIQDTYRYGCGIMQKSTYESTTFPTTQAKPAWIAWHTGSTGTQSGAITFTAQSDTVYWVWSLGRLSDNVLSTIIFTARIF